MPPISFKKQFVPLIESGAKRQTIRSRKHPIKVGDRLYLYTGMRTQDCTKIAESICIEVERFSLSKYLHHDPVVHVDYFDLSPTAIADLAFADGFTNQHEFINFFLESPKATKEDGVINFSGQIIKWGVLCKP